MFESPVIASIVIGTLASIPFEQRATFYATRRVAALAWNLLGRPLQNPPKWLENIACGRAYKVLESDYPSSRRGKLKQWGQISFINRVFRWSDGDLSLTVLVDNPEQIDSVGIEEYFWQRQIPVNVHGEFDTDRWTVGVDGDMDDARIVDNQVKHAVERNRLRRGQSGISQRSIEMDLS